MPGRVDLIVYIGYYKNITNYAGIIGGIKNGEDMEDITSESSNISKEEMIEILRKERAGFEEQKAQFEKVFANIEDKIAQYEQIREKVKNEMPSDGIFETDKDYRIALLLSQTESFINELKNSIPASIEELAKQEKLLDLADEMTATDWFEFKEENPS